ncbi:MAG TPA: CapA family protein [Candidatus Acidoferrales bacterium]|nr:CapA family protein [Candidatus Acidoferrales bacterium]
MPYEAERGAITIALGGDVMPSRRLAVHREPEFLKLREILASADATFANLETLVIRYGEGHPSVRTGTHMVTEPELLEDLKWFGFKMVSCANSHSFNFGEEGLLLQNRYLDEAGLLHAGTGANLRQASSPVYLDTPRGRVALIAATAHIHSLNHRAGHQRVDFPGKPGVNPLGHKTTFVVDREAFAALRRIGSQLGFDAERQRVLDHGFHAPSEVGAASDTEYEFRGERYVLGKTFDIRTECNRGDVEENLRQIREARRQADFVIMSLHNQEMIGRSWLTATRRVDVDQQPEFVVEFARQAIDAGADIFACHGPHMFLGIEIYNGKPIFYSLGNLIFQNDTLRHIPANPYERFRLDPYATPSDFFDRRSANDTRGHAATPESLESAVAVCDFEDKALRQIRLYPVDLGFGRPRSQRGRPILAGPELARKILDRIARLSQFYGTPIEQADGLGIVRV